MSIILYIAAPLVFHAEIPQNPGKYFISLAIFIAVSLSIASTIGLAVKDQAKTSMFSIIVFIPSTMLFEIMFFMEFLPKTFQIIGKLFPASWEYKLMMESTLKFQSLFGRKRKICMVCTEAYKEINLLIKNRDKNQD